MIFVFGSNLAGIHGAGAALFARKNYGAVYGEGRGRTGNSYALPTKNQQIKTLPLQEIQKYVTEFVMYASKNSNLEFKLTRIGCGLAGYVDNEILALFPPDLPDNIYVPPEWANHFKNNKHWV